MIIPRERVFAEHQMYEDMERKTLVLLQRGQNGIVHATEFYDFDAAATYCSHIMAGMQKIWPREYAKYGIDIN